MKDISALFYLVTLYICLISFFWNFNTFTFQEKIIMFTLFSGFQCISYLCQSNMKV